MSLPVTGNHDSEESLHEGISASEHTAGSGVKAAEKSARKIAGSPGKAVKLGKNIGQTVAQTTARVTEFLLANPEFLIVAVIIALIIIAVVIICSVSAAWMRNGSPDQRPWLNREDRDSAYAAVFDVVEECVDEANTEVIHQAEELCEQYIEDHFSDHEQEVEYVVMHDSSNEIAAHITPYILAVNGAIQYDVSDTGLDVFFQIRAPEALNQNEYNWIGARFRDVVREYAETQLFYIDKEHLVDEVELVTEERTVTDRHGDPVIDQFGKEVTEEVEVYHGTIYLGIGYYIGDYKKQDIEEAVEHIFNDRKERRVHSEKETYSEYVKEYIYDLIYEETGSREFNLWGGYGQGMAVILRSIANIDFEDLDLNPGSIEAILSLGSHGIQADWGLLSELEAAQKAGMLTMRSRTGEGYPYCTEWAHFFMYLAHGRDYNTNPGADGGDGNGANIARTLAMRYPGDWYVPSDGLPSAGAVFSVTKINSGAGHVGMITKVEGDRIWYCDGNLLRHGYNVRLNESCTLEEFMRRYPGGEVYFANHR